MPPFDVQWSPCTGCGGTNMVSTIFQGSSVIDSAMLRGNATSWTPNGLFPGQEYGLIVGVASVDVNTTLVGGTEYLSSFTYVNNSAFVVGGGTVTPQEVVRLGQPANPDAFRGGLTGGPAVGSSWYPYVDHGVFTPTATFDFLMLSIQPPINVPTSIGTLLCLVPPPSQIFSGPAQVPFALSVPLEPHLIGFSATTQAGSVAGGVPHLTNAIDIIVGTN